MTVSQILVQYNVYSFVTDKLSYTRRAGGGETVAYGRLGCGGTGQDETREAQEDGEGGAGLLFRIGDCGEGWGAHPPCRRSVGVRISFAFFLRNCGCWPCSLFFRLAAGIRRRL